jgi:hypothetical protein
MCQILLSLWIGWIAAVSALKISRELQPSLDFASRAPSDVPQKMCLITRRTGLACEIDLDRLGTYSYNPLNAAIISLVQNGNSPVSCVGFPISQPPAFRTACVLAINFDVIDRDQL